MKKTPVMKLIFPITKVFVRSLIIALVLGTSLTLLNQYQAIVGVGEIDKLSVFAVFATPFITAFLSQFLVYNRHHKHRHFKPLLWQKIVISALILGLLLGSINSAMFFVHAFVTNNVFAPPAVAAPPTALLIQAFILPLVFSTIIQSLSHKRLYKEVAI